MAVTFSFSKTRIEAFNPIHTSPKKRKIKNHRNLAYTRTRTQCPLVIPGWMRTGNRNIREEKQKEKYKVRNDTKSRRRLIQSAAGNIKTLSSKQSIKPDAQNVDGAKEIKNNKPGETVKNTLDIMRRPKKKSSNDSKPPVCVFHPMPTSFPSPSVVHMPLA
jgi:hypothetical protein